MKTVGIADLKAHLSQHLRAVRRGETLTVMDRREPVAKLVPVLSTGTDLVIRPAVGRLHELTLPGPIRGAKVRDVVKDLLTERADRE